MDAKQLEKMMGFAPGELEKTAEAYEKDEWPKGRTIKLGRHQSLMSRASLYQHVWANRFLRRLTKKPNAMGKHARSGSESSLHLMH